MHFADKLLTAVSQTSPICVGIDPRINLIPDFIKQKNLDKYGNTTKAVAMSFYDFAVEIIDAVHDLVPVIKPQLAFFEMYGSEGVKSFEDICLYAQKKGLIVLADGKRNDIGTTAEAYAQGMLSKVPLIQENVAVNFIDAATVNPYLGSDGIKPFLETIKKEEKGIFVLVKTSNPSSYEIQDLPTREELVHEEVARLVSHWGMNDLGKNHFSSVGVVVGAVHTDEAQYLRSLMPNQIFLVPGYGAQGGNAQDIKHCFNADGLGAIINSSRAINFAYLNNKKYTEHNFSEAAREAVLKMKKDLSEVVG